MKPATKIKKGHGLAVKAIDKSRDAAITILDGTDDDDDIDPAFYENTQVDWQIQLLASALQVSLVNYRRLQLKIRTADQHDYVYQMLSEVINKLKEH